MSDPSQPLPEGDQKRETVRTMFDSIAPRYDLVNRVMTFGMDVGWRKKTVASLGLPAGSMVLDIACGTGDLLRILEAAHHRAVGIDISAGMLRAARTNAPLLQADGLALPFADGTVDGITCGFALRNVVSLPDLFEEMARVLRPGGRFAFLEVAQPDNRVLRAGHSVYFNKVVPVIGGLLSDRAAYRYLPRSAAYLPPTPVLLEMLVERGFHDVDGATLRFGAAQVITGTRS